MKEQLISFEVAKLAKEKGFDLNSPGFYSCDDPSSGTKGNQLVLRDWEKWTNFGSEDSQEGTFIYSAPTQSLLQKWLRDIHNIYVEPFPIIGRSNLSFSWQIYTKNNIWGINKFTGRKFSTYEETLEAVLLEALKLI